MNDNGGEMDSNSLDKDSNSDEELTLQSGIESNDDESASCSRQVLLLNQEHQLPSRRRVRGAVNSRRRGIRIRSGSRNAFRSPAKWKRDNEESSSYDHSPEPEKENLASQNYNGCADNDKSGNASLSDCDSDSNDT